MQAQGNTEGSACLGRSSNSKLPISQIGGPAAIGAASAVTPRKQDGYLRTTRMGGVPMPATNGPLPSAAAFEEKPTTIAVLAWPAASRAGKAQSLAGSHLTRTSFSPRLLCGLPRPLVGGAAWRASPDQGLGCRRSCRWTRRESWDTGRVRSALTISARGRALTLAGSCREQPDWRWWLRERQDRFAEGYERGRDGI